MSSDQTPEALAGNLEMLERLLDTLTDVLDIRDVFHRVSHVAQSVLPHDLLGVIEVSDDGTRMRLHASSVLGQPTFDAPITPSDRSKVEWDVVIVEDFTEHPEHAEMPAVKAGMLSMIGVPVRFGGRLRARIHIFSRHRARFSLADVPIAQRLAGHVALAMSHHQLAEEATQRQALEARASALELLDRSLSLLTDGGGLVDRFSQISGVTQPLMAHDAVVLSVLSPDGRHARAHACVGVEIGSLPDAVEVPERAPHGEYDILDDIAARPEADHVLAALGFRSALRLPVRLDARFVGALTFLSRMPGAFQQHHLPVARRVANRLAVSLEREWAAEAARRADEATERAAHLEARVRALTDELDARAGYRRVIGESLPWREVLTQAMQVAATETTVLLLGESGTGKEVVARLVHRASARKNAPFIALNCAALPEQLLESELFGFERGAFTGATQSRLGQIEQAAGGVLFLDEVGEMTLSAQVKLLRVLQEREFQRLGGSRVIRADVRVVAATNRDLAKALERGAFREDLYYRLNVFPIALPPLRERREDILPMTDVFIQEIGKSLGRPPAGLARDARQALLDYHWPGNVRELRNVIERAAILADGGLIARDHFSFAHRGPLAVASASAVHGPVTGSSDAPMSERALIERALHEARFNKAKAAKALGLTRAQLYVRLRRHGLE